MIQTDFFTGWYFLGANDIGGWIFLFIAGLIGALFVWADTRWRRTAFRKWFIWAALPLSLLVPTIILLLRTTQLGHIDWLPLVVAVAGCMGTLLTGFVVVLYAVRFLVQFPGQIYYLEESDRNERRLLKRGITNLEDTLFVKVNNEGCSLAIPASRQQVTVDGAAVRRTTLHVDQTCRIEVGDRKFTLIVMD